MKTPSVRTVLTATLLSLSLFGTLTGCATPVAGESGPGAAPAASAPPPDGEVSGQGTVIDDGSGVQLCLGAVTTSYPPQCSGVPVDGWTWEGLEGVESASGVTWGAFAVQGTYDGTRFSVTGTPIMLALYDPMPLPDPTDGRTGASDATTLEAAQAEISAGPTDVLSSFTDRGYLWVDVVWDDGTVQKAWDDVYGADVVVVRSALRVIGG